MNTLLTIHFSHYCDKARWALERAGLPFREAAHLPIFSRLAGLVRGEWGTVPMLAPIDGDTDSVASVVIDTLRKSGKVGAGAPIVVVNVSPGLAPGTGNFLKIRRA